MSSQSVPLFKTLFIKALLGVIDEVLSAMLTEGKRTSNSWTTATEFQSPKVIFPQTNFGRSLSCSLSQFDVAKTSPLGEVDMYTCMSTCWPSCHAGSAWVGGKAHGFTESGSLGTWLGLASGETEGPVADWVKNLVAGNRSSSRMFDVVPRRNIPSCVNAQMKKTCCDIQTLEDVKNVIFALYLHYSNDFSVRRLFRCCCRRWRGARSRRLWFRHSREYMQAPLSTTYYVCMYQFRQTLGGKLPFIFFFLRE